MDLALVASALALGLAGAPHCVAMCAAPCELAVGHGGARSRWTFHLARVVAYAAVGAVAAASVNALAALGALSPMFRPLWSLLHAAALALGIWLAWTGRQPKWLESVGRGREPSAGAIGGWSLLRGPVRAGVVGAAWVAWPCGLLQSAVLVAALASSPASGAMVMAAFGSATAFGLVVGPMAWRRLGGGRISVAAGTAGIRLAGALLAMSSGWVLGRGLWQAGVAYCTT